MIQTKDTTITDELTACPFCGATEHVGLRWEEEPDELFYVVCAPCGGRTMGGNTEAEAITAWNTRAKETPTSASPTPRGEVE